MDENRILYILLGIGIAVVVVGLALFFGQ